MIDWGARGVRARMGGVTHMVACGAYGCVEPHGARVARMGRGARMECLAPHGVRGPLGAWGLGAASQAKREGYPYVRIHLCSSSTAPSPSGAPLSLAA